MVEALNLIVFHRFLQRIYSKNYFSLRSMENEELNFYYLLNFKEKFHSILKKDLHKNLVKIIHICRAGRVVQSRILRIDDINDYAL